MSGYAAVRGCSSEDDEVAGVPVGGDLDHVTAAARAFGAGTVAMLACPEKDGVRPRGVAWDLEKTGTDLCVSPIGVMIRLPDRGPAFFTQARIGKDGRVIRMCKFRTIDDTLARVTSQIQRDCLPETNNCVCRPTRRRIIMVRPARVFV
jgi:Bacterial sugar transferase